MSIRSFAQTLEYALIMEDRMDYAVYVLSTTKAQQLFSSLKRLLDQKADAINMVELKVFLEENKKDLDIIADKAIHASFSE